MNVFQNRQDWAAYDLMTHEGTSIEVKCASYIQSWDQKRFSYISFGIKETLAWQESMSTYDTVKKRQISLSALNKIVEPVEYGGLREKVEASKR